MRTPTGRVGSGTRGSGSAAAPGASSQSGGVSISRKILSAPAIARSPWLYWFPMIVIGEKKKFESRMNVIRSSALIPWWNTRQPPTTRSVATKNWLLSSRIGASTAEVLARAMLNLEWSARRLLKSPAFMSCLTNPWVTRMPFTDSASVAVTRLKLSWEARVSRLSFILKWLFTIHRSGAMHATTRNIFQSL